MYYRGKSQQDKHSFPPAQSACLSYVDRTAQLCAIGPILLAANGDSPFALVEEDLGSIPVLS